MMFGLDGIGAIIGGVGDIVDDLHTSDEERLDNELKSKKLDVSVVNKIHDTNAIEAKHRSIFVAGWRPFIGWVCGVAIGLSFIPKAIGLTGMWVYQNYLLLSGKFVENTADLGTGEAINSIPELLVFPELGTGELMSLTISLLGLGGLRTYEKFKKVSK